jgi:hypothetical protein
MSDLDRAVCNHNLAVFEFLNDEFHEMVVNLQASLEYWRAKNLELRGGIDEGYMGVAYRELGDIDKSREAWSRSRAILKTSNFSGLETARSWMELAQLATRLKDRELAEECLYSGLETTSIVDNQSDLAPYFLQMLAFMRSSRPSIEDLKLPKIPCYLEPFSQGNLVSLCGPDIHLH